MRRKALLFWPVSLILAAVLAVAVYVFTTPSTPTATVSVPTRMASPSATPSLPTTPHTPQDAPSPSTSVHHVASSSPAPDAIEGSAPVELYLPAFDAHIPMDTKTCPVNAEGSWEPDQTKPQAACYVKDATHPYVWPATDTADLSVIAGHTGQQVAAAFNLLYDWRTQRFAVKAGDELWVRTKTSGNRWLRYKATQFFTPDKYGPQGLAHDSGVWGTAPEPNTLITIGCLQPQALGVETTRNIVIKWAYVGVKS